MTGIPRTIHWNSWGTGCGCPEPVVIPYAQYTVQNGYDGIKAKAGIQGAVQGRTRRKGLSRRSLDCNPGCTENIAYTAGAGPRIRFLLFRKTGYRGPYSLQQTGRTKFVRQIPNAKNLHPGLVRTGWRQAFTGDQRGFSVRGPRRAGIHKPGRTGRLHAAMGPVDPGSRCPQPMETHR